MINKAFKKFSEFTEELVEDGYCVFFVASDSSMDDTDDDFSPISYNGVVTVFVVKDENEDDDEDEDEDEEGNLILLKGDAVFSQSFSTYDLIGSVAEQNLEELTAFIRAAVLHDKTIAEFKTVVFPDGVSFDVVMN